MACRMMRGVKPLRYTSAADMAPPPVGRLDRPMVGIGFNAASFVATSCADTMSKIAAVVLPAPQIILLRAVFILALLSPMFWSAVRKGDAPWHTRRFGLHMLRSGLQMTAMVAFLTALKFMPLTTVVSIQFVAPLLVAVFAAVLLKEKLSWGQLGPIILGFAGCMIILRPGTEAFTSASFFAVVSAVSWAMVIVLLRRMTETESASTILFWQNATQLVTMICIAPFIWVTVSSEMYLVLFALSAAQSMGQWLGTKALSYAKAATVAPLQYTMLLWITLLGWLVFNEWPGPHVWLGAGVIILSGLWLMRAQSGTLRLH